MVAVVVVEVVDMVAVVTREIMDMVIVHHIHHR
jgi:hypothetical protein